MPSSQKNKVDTGPKKSTLSSRVANLVMAGASNELTVMLTAKMEKQRENLKEDMATLIQASLAPIQSSESESERVLFAIKVGTDKEFTLAGR